MLNCFNTIILLNVNDIKSNTIKLKIHENYFNIKQF